jgi:nucleoid DNA-binding protein
VRVLKTRTPKWKGSDLEAPLVSDFDLLKEIWKETLLPTWVVKKVIKSFFETIKKKMMVGSLISIHGLGTFVPYRGIRGIRGTSRYDPAHSKIAYKFKISNVLKCRISNATIRGTDVQRSQS